MRNFLFVLAFCLVGLTNYGCSGSTSVSGHVTYEGVPVEQGSITFTPADGIGPSSGAVIEGGAYRVDDIEPGEKLVQISGGDQINAPSSTEELAQQASSRTKPTPPNRIPRNAVGNNKSVTVEPGTQSFVFQLTKPTK